VDLLNLREGFGPSNFFEVTMRYSNLVLALIIVTVGSYAILMACGPLTPTIRTEHEIETNTQVTVRIETDLCDKVLPEDQLECNESLASILGMLEENDVAVEDDSVAEPVNINGQN
jgi:hypothetical protein